MLVLLGPKSAKFDYGAPSKIRFGLLGLKNERRGQLQVPQIGLEPSGCHFLFNLRAIPHAIHFFRTPKMARFSPIWVLEIK